ncbi:MAG: insulinase family protein [Rectinema sp.]
MSFVLQKETSVPELDSVLRLYRHEPTGARLLSVINKDENKVFGITFRTPPSRSDGVAHIIEHSVLCGSRKYPVKEPFVELMKGSLNTFLNAMTYPDKTCYPVASANLKDFYNLIDVYLDAVFYPNLTEHTFMQEGWHYEVDPATKKLSYKGVVFNEMKGAYSDPDDMHDDLCRRSLYPDTPYGLDSGGDPLEIPALSYEEFLRFHARYYHPANSFIFFYGDDDPDTRLAIMEDWLAPFGRATIESLPAAQPGFLKPRHLEYKYQASDQDEAKAYTAVNWALYEHGDPELSMKTAILFHILTGTPASPLRKALIESGLGEDLAGFGFSEELRQTAFSIGLKGVDPATTAEVENLIFSTLEQLARDGIDADTIAASINTLEFALREKNTGRFPRGLAIMLDALNDWLYDHDPIAAIAFAGPFEKVKKAAAENPRLFSELIDTLLLRNMHRTTVVLLPSTDAAKEREEKEKAMLAQARATFGPQELQEIEKTVERLKALQNTPDSPEALATIPVLSLDDIPKQAPVLPSEPLNLGLGTNALPLRDPKGDTEAGLAAYYHDLATNGILYLDLGFDFGALDSKLLPYVSLLGRFLLEMGTEKENFVQLIQRIGMHTGGIRSTSVCATSWKGQRPAPWFFLRAKALPEKADFLVDILGDVLARARFDDRERVRQIVLEEKAQAEAMLVPASARIVGLRLRSRFNVADWASERLYGIEHLFFLRDLARRVEEDWPSVLADMERLRIALIDRGNLIVNVTADRATLAASADAVGRLVDSLLARHVSYGVGESAVNAGAGTSWIDDALAACGPSVLRPGLETLELPTQVNSVGMVLPLQDLNQAAGAVYVASKYLDAVYLWGQVRVMGGAYGGYSSLDLASSLLVLLSYRDPNLERTIEVYRKVSNYLKSAVVSNEEIHRAIIGTIGEVDAYQLPDAKGFNALLNELTGYTQEVRQTIRDQILATDADDFRRLGEMIEEAMQRSMMVALSAPERIDKALPALPTPIERLSV